MNTKELLEKRRMLKRKKPEFVRQDAHKKKKLGWKWRKPKGSDSKMRVSRKGYKRSVRIGWGSPAAVKGLDRQGLKPVHVSRVADLDKVNPQTDVIVISSSVGAKNRLAIIEKALGKKIKVANYKDPAKSAEEMKKGFEQRKKDKQNLKQEREKKKEAAKKEAEKKKAKEEKDKAKKDDDSEKQSDAEKKLEEKQEKDKLLISTQ